VRRRETNTIDQEEEKRTKRRAQQKGEQQAKTRTRLIEEPQTLLPGDDPPIALDQANPTPDLDILDLLDLLFFLFLLLPVSVRVRLSTEGDEVCAGGRPGLEARRALGAVWTGMGDEDREEERRCEGGKDARVGRVGEGEEGDWLDEGKIT
jgi:hypothetical protein